jgi:hypothetical protein
MNKKTAHKKVFGFLLVTLFLVSIFAFQVPTAQADTTEYLLFDRSGTYTGTNQRICYVYPENSTNTAYVSAMASRLDIASVTYYLTQLEVDIRRVNNPVGEIRGFVTLTEPQNDPYYTNFTLSLNTVSMASLTTSRIPYNFTFDSFELPAHTRFYYGILVESASVLDSTNYASLQYYSSSFGQYRHSNSGWEWISNWYPFGKIYGTTTPKEALLPIEDWARNIQTTVYPTGGGTITIHTSYPYYIGQNFSVEAVPTTGWFFSHWTRNGIFATTVANHTFTNLQSDEVFQAVFVDNRQVEAKFWAYPSTTEGRVTWDLYNPGSTVLLLGGYEGEFNLDVGKEIKVGVLHTNSSYRFSHWIAETGIYSWNISNSPLIFTIEADFELTAVFVPLAETNNRWVQLGSFQGGTFEVRYENNPITPDYMPMRDLIVGDGEILTFRATAAKGYNYLYTRIAALPSNTTLLTSTGNHFIYTVEADILVTPVFSRTGSTGGGTNEIFTDGMNVLTGIINNVGAMDVNLIFALIIILASALLCGAFAGLWGFVAGFNLGVVLSIMFSLISPWLIVVIVLVDVVLLWGKAGFGGGGGGTGGERVKDAWGRDSGGYA